MNPPHMFNGSQHFPPTPQSAKFGGHSFQSPATANTSPTDFQNGWMTPQDYNFTTSFQTPGASFENGFMEEPSSSSSATSMKRPRPESYQNYIPKLETKKMVPAPTLKQETSNFNFPTTSFLEQFDSTHLDEFTNFPPVIPTQVVQAEQAPTPPPTRDQMASARREANRMRQVMPVHMTAETAPPRRMSVPDPAPIAQSAMFNFDNLELTMPEMYNFDLSGPVTAPAYPQSSVFWDPSASVDLGQPIMPMLTSELVPQQHMVPPSYVFQSAPVQPSANGEHQGFAVPSLPSQGSRPQTAHSARSGDSTSSRARASTMQSMHSRKASSVDPSVLFTAGAPGAQPIGSSGLFRSNSVISNASVEARQPYQYQTEALRREREARSQRVQQASRKSSVDHSEAEVAAVGLRRTGSRSRHAGSVPRSAHASSVDLSASMAPSMSEQGHIPRHPSPLKQNRSAMSQKADASVSGKPPVVLRIDSQGRAVTTAKVAEVKSAHKSRTRVAFREDGESESDSDDEDLPTGPARSRAPVLAAHGMNRSRSLRTSPTRGTTLGRTRSLRTSPNKNEAQQALHEAIKQRPRQSVDLGKSFSIALPAGADPFISAPSFAMPPPPPPQPQYVPARQDSAVWNIPQAAPVDFNMQHTPPETFEKQFLEQTRCVCNNMVPNDGQLMVQCESCTKWLHVTCLGMNTQALPPVFVCVFCTQHQQRQQQQQQQQQQQHQHHMMAVPQGQQVQYYPAVQYGMPQQMPMQTMYQLPSQHYM